jgi:hypothetical protein
LRGHIRSVKVHNRCNQWWQAYRLVSSRVT